MLCSWRCPRFERAGIACPPLRRLASRVSCRAQVAAAKSYPRSPFLTGGRVGTCGSGRSLVPEDRLPLDTDKQIVFVRHGATTWNSEKRIQGSSDESHLTDFGREQAIKTRDGLANFPFKACFASPISRAKEFADIIWNGRDPPIMYRDELREAYLGAMQGCTNAHASEHYSDIYEMWRTNPAEFEIEGRRPVYEIFDHAERAWAEILLHPSDVTLVVSHKSVLRAFMCTALGLGPAAFRAVDMHNAGVTIFWVNRDGEAMLQNMNMTAHLEKGRPY